MSGVPTFIIAAASLGNRDFTDLEYPGWAARSLNHLLTFANLASKSTKQIKS